jgi:hypothetical protein
MQQSKKYAFINSQDQRYFDTIGKYMLKSFLTYAPAHFDLYFYNEGINDLEGIEKYKNFHNINWNETCGVDWQKFANNCPSDTSAQKFGKKGWASIHGWRNIKADYLVWLDADLLFYKNFNEDIINTTINENKLIGLFDHAYTSSAKHGEGGFSAETGYVVLNCNHPNYNDFVDEYQRLYELKTKPDKIVSWWDNQICMLAASKFMPAVFDLSTLRFKDKTQTPMNHSPLAEYFGHQKGKSKKHLDEKYFKEKTGL